MIRQSPTGVILQVRVIPRARKTELAGTRGHALLVRLAAPPLDGAANHALVRFLADTVGVPLRAVRILSGTRGREKQVAVDGLTVTRAEARLTNAASPDRARRDA